jgi:6,7-dimethyl-8-ribityllumazine synthase
VKSGRLPRAAGCRFAIVVSRFNPEITDGLLAGAREALTEADVRDDDVTIVRVPGAFELPLRRSAWPRAGRFDAIILPRCLIKGDTMHFEYIADAATRGIADVGLATGVPIAFGVLTTLTDEQAEIRALPGAGNKGREAAAAAEEMATLLRVIDGGPAA